MYIWCNEFKVIYPQWFWITPLSPSRIRQFIKIDSLYNLTYIFLIRFYVLYVLCVWNFFFLEKNFHIYRFGPYNTFGFSSFDWYCVQLTRFSTMFGVSDRGISAHVYISMGAMSCPSTATILSPWYEKIYSEPWKNPVWERPCSSVAAPPPTSQIPMCFPPWPGFSRVFINRS